MVYVVAATGTGCGAKDVQNTNSERARVPERFQSERPAIAGLDRHGTRHGHSTRHGKGLGLRRDLLAPAGGAGKKRIGDFATLRRRVF